MRELGRDQVSEPLRIKPSQVHCHHVIQQPGQHRVIEPGRQHVLPPLPRRPAQRRLPLHPSPVPGRVLRRDEHYDHGRMAGVEGGEFLSQVLAPQLYLLISVVKAAHSPRLQRNGDPPYVLPLRPRERQRHIPLPSRPGVLAYAAVLSRHEQSLPPADTGTRSRPRVRTLVRGPLTDSGLGDHIPSARSARSARRRAAHQQTQPAATRPVREKLIVLRTAPSKRLPERATRIKKHRKPY